MEKKMKKISKLLLIFVVSIFGIVSLTGCYKKQETQDKLTIVSTNFPSYDSDKYVGKKIKVRGFTVKKRTSLSTKWIFRYR